ncbi:ErpA-related iron-sulfur cluster insertion protein [Desulfovibrio sp. Huiquan2017]|uniref:ErpA-related iron-sulfur cluster insertion protein n=1 Tax=Desulfovibrio sp. Huiquan2017 TaxID=2816861 RepID=UPI001A925D2D|nr:ErpA-related iron-sulfur cluster insertion protein [Desulfovibrio sp. Huiquan2017]
MFTVDTTEELLGKLRDLLAEEDPETCVRLREYNAGCGCHSKIRLGLGLDEPEEEDEQISVQGIPFVAEKDFLLKHGRSYALAFDENKETVLTPLDVSD